MTSGQQLTSEQAEVVDACSDARQLVLAPAGTGKTLTLVRRLEHLVNEEGLSPGSEILVLSFSRAAVTEVRRRLSLGHGEAAYISAYTFDSFATRLLSESSRDESWVNGRYDDRIRFATSLLQDPASSMLQLSELRHVLIDEVQDLVAVRVDYVLSLLGRAQCGFTLLGDPAQRIYGFRSSEARAESAEGFLPRLRRQFGADLITRRLSSNFRARSPIAKSILGLAPTMESDDLDVKSVSRAVRDTLLGLKVLKPLSLAQGLARRSNGAVALLARTNGEILMVARQLSSLGIAHQYQSRAEHRACPDWVGRALRGIVSTSPGRRLLLDRLAPLAEEMEADVEDLWAAMWKLGRGRNRSVDLDLVGRRIRSGAIPEDIPVVERCALKLSTIHRAKGLEFDAVVLIEPPENRLASLDSAEELRIAYVGLTRARDQIYVTPSPDTRGMRLLRGARNRWCRTGFGPARSRLFALELLPRDIDSLSPAGATIPLSAPPSEIQDYIATEVRPCDPVRLELIRSTSSGPELAYYGLVHEDQIVGITSEEFSHDLRRALRPRDRCRWPLRIDSLFVEKTETFAGLPSIGQQFGLGNSGTWLGVRVCGLGELDFARDREN